MKKIQISEKMLITIFDSVKPCLCNVILSPSSRVIPQVKAGRANEDMEPLLDRELFNRLMITQPMSQEKSH